MAFPSEVGTQSEAPPAPSALESPRHRQDAARGRRERARARALELLGTPDGVLTRVELEALGYERRAVDAILRACPVERWPGYSRPLIRVASFLEWRERCTTPADCDISRTLRGAR